MKQVTLYLASLVTLQKETEEILTNAQCDERADYANWPDHRRVRCREEQFNARPPDWRPDIPLQPKFLEPTASDGVALKVSHRVM
jgi:hypothetical protein